MIATPEQLEMARRIAANECAAASWKRAIALGEMDDWHGVKIALAAIIETQRLDAEFVEKFGPSDDIGNYETATAIRVGQHYGKDRQ